MTPFDWVTALQVGSLRVRFPMMSLEFFIDIYFPAALRPWSRVSLYHKWVPEYILGGKDSRCARLTTSPPSCVCCHEKWKPQPPGILKVCPRLHRNFFLIILTVSKRIIYYVFIYKCVPSRWAETLEIRIHRQTDGRIFSMCKPNAPPNLSWRKRNMFSKNNLFEHGAGQCLFCGIYPLRCQYMEEKKLEL